MSHFDDYNTALRTYIRIYMYDSIFYLARYVYFFFHFYSNRFDNNVWFYYLHRSISSTTLNTTKFVDFIRNRRKEMCTRRMLQHNFKEMLDCIRRSYKDELLNYLSISSKSYVTNTFVAIGTWSSSRRSFQTAGQCMEKRCPL